ncbi:MAG: putative virulence factor, partial [Muribaculaceae bacterium]|nr:putative virulence factor [Muribaculaceae bacterium]
SCARRGVEEKEIDLDSALTSDAINRELEGLYSIWNGKQKQQDIISEDDIRDINDYIREVIGNNAAAIYQSNFCKIVSSVIQNVPYDKWVDVFSLIWNKNSEINRLFTTLINAYKKLSFKQEVYVPFDTVLYSKGTLLKIEWLDAVCGVYTNTGNDDVFTNVYDFDGHLLASNFNKGELSALIAELTFELPEYLSLDRKFLKYMDLLDFPGARSREKYKEKEIATVLPKMLRRGKVAYLFNKYSRSLQISSVLFCHHNDQKAEPTIGETINNWIEENIGATPQERAKVLHLTNGIAPLFFVATKFNIDLERTKTDKPESLENLDKHWNRFDTVFPEIIKPNKWLDEWSVLNDGSISPFRNIYPLRDFYWSGKNGLFSGYSDGTITSPETALCKHPDYPDYFDRLKESLI